METEQIELDREDVILLILEANERLLRRKSLNGITRLEKLLFLLERETDFEGVAEFVFVPYHFGPFSKEVFEAIEFLDACELINVQEKTYTSLYSNSNERKLTSEISDGAEEDEMPVTERQFALTEDGRKVAGIMRNAVRKRRPSDVEELDRIVRQYGTRPLNHLIRYVYRQYPDMTEKSIHSEAQNAHQQ